MPDLARFRRRKSLLLPVVTVMAVAAPVQGQQRATSFDQLSVLVAPGDKVTVSGVPGGSISGTITSLSASGLTLRVGKELRTFQERDVDTVRHRRQDPLANGALWGLGVGAVAGFTPCGRCHIGPGLMMGGIFGGIGAGIGVGIDALIKGNVTIFRRRDSSTRIVVTPMLAPSHKAVNVSLQF
jgi:hypothetical protein